MQYTGINIAFNHIKIGGKNVILIRLLFHSSSTYTNLHLSCVVVHNDNQHFFLSYIDLKIIKIIVNVI